MAEVDYGIHCKIPFEMLDRKDYVEHYIEHLKNRGAEEIFREIYKANHPIVVETHIESWDEWPHCKIFKLHYRLTAVQTRNVVWEEMSSFTFTNHLGKIEWKCRYCSTINSIEATFCGEKHQNAIGCGHPREKTKQEMYA